MTKTDVTQGLPHDADVGNSLNRAVINVDDLPRLRLPGLRLSSGAGRSIARYSGPRATARVGSELHSDHDPGYNAASRPIAASAAIVTVAVTPEPQ